MVAMFFVVSVSNNYALNFNIALPLHMIFRAGSLLANMILGIILLKKRYTSMKYISVFAISAGISICTIASGKELVSCSIFWSQNFNLKQVGKIEPLCCRETTNRMVIRSHLLTLYGGWSAYLC